MPLRRNICHRCAVDTLRDRHSPQNILAVRVDGKVTITWDVVKMTSDDDRGYFLELFVCQNGHYLWYTASLETQTEKSYTVKDETDCPLPSSGKRYAVEKHGYTRPVDIPWPAP